MSKLKLTKKIASGNRLVFSPSWITDGHWAIRRELVEYGEHFNATIANVFLDTIGSSDMTDEQIRIPADPDLNDKYEMSSIIIALGVQLRVFFNQNNSYICVDERFRNILGIEELYPSYSVENLFLNDVADRVLMMVKVSAEVDSRLKLPLKALDSLKDGAE